MKSHERFVASNSENNHENNDESVHESNREINRENGERNVNRAVKRFVKFGEKALPEYTRKIWTNTYETMEPRKLDGLVDILVAIKAQAYNDAATMIKQDWISDGLMMGTVATLLPEGVEVVRQVYTDTWGEAGLKKNIEFLDKTRDWHVEQHKAVRNRADKALKANFTGEKAPRTHHKIEQAEQVEQIEQVDSEAYYGPTTREKFMERVHDMFGPEEARMLVYKIRNANMIGKPVDPPFDFQHYESYAASVSFVGETDEPKYFPGIMEWTEEKYKRDLKSYKQNFVEWIASDTYPTEKREIELLEKAIDNIDAHLEEGNEKWTYKREKFPTALTVQGNINDFDNNRDFMYRKDLTTAYNSYFGHQTYGETTARLYMCPRTDNMLQLIDAFENQCKKKHIRYSFKYSSDPSRNDRFIIYTNYDRINDHINALREISQERPELFKDMDDSRKNPFWGKIDGAPQGVYFGEEPPKLVMIDKDGKVESRNPYTSYSQERADAFERADKKWAEAVYGEVEDDYSNGFGGIADNAMHFSSPSEISWEDAKYLEQIFRNELRKLDITTYDNICFNRSSADWYTASGEPEDWTDAQRVAVEKGNASRH